MKVNLNDFQWKRNKIIAILLAIFLGPWTWIYTFRKDAEKASIGLAINLSTQIFFIMLYISYMQSAAGIPLEQRQRYDIVSLGLAVLLMVFSFIWFIIWFWALIDTTTKNRVWFYTDNHKKRKRISVLLSIFLGPWTWLYTYSKDWWKFWMGVIIGYGSLFQFYLGFGNWINIDERLRLIIFLSITAVIWIMSILLSITKQKETELKK